MIKEKLMAGGLAGIISSLIVAAYGVLVKTLGLTDRALFDYAMILVTFRTPTDYLSFIIAILAFAAFCMNLGIIFILIIDKTSSNYLILKGIAYGFGLWFIINGSGTIFRIPMFMEIPNNSAISTLIGGILFGLVLSISLRIFDKKQLL